MDDQKEKMDDLASLFLPDLLHPLSTLNLDALIKQEDDGFHAALFQDEQSYHSAMNMQMNPQDNQQPFDNDGGHSMMSSDSFSYANQGGGMRFLPYPNAPEEPLTHISHYQDFVPVEAGIQPSKRYHKMPKQYLPHVMPFQQAWSPLTVIGQFDGGHFMSPQSQYNNIAGFNYPMLGMHSDSGEPQLMMASKAATPEITYSPISGNDRPASARQAQAEPSDKAQARKQRRRGKKVPDTEELTPVDKQATVETIRIDYNPKRLLKLLDLEPTAESPQIQIFDHANQPVDIVFRGFIAGRFYTNNKDNFNHISATKEIPFLGKVYRPEVISCYRRNFIHINLNFHRSSDYNLLTIPGKGVVNGFRIEVLAVANGEGSRPISVIINKEKDTIKESSKGYSDVLFPQQIGTTHKVLVAESAGDNYFTVRKAQFKSATANSLSVNFQTFNNFVVRLIAELDLEEVVVKELRSSAIIVRGRNPSFYHERKDILIKSRPVVSKSSFSMSEIDVSDDEPTEKPNTGALSLSTGDTSPENETDKKVKNEPQSSSEPEFPTRSRETEFGKDTKIKVDRQTPVSSETGLSANLKELLDPKSFVDENGKPKRYRYFPISNVYYLPPINAVYFPHRAHQLKQEAGVDASLEEDLVRHSSATKASGEKKRPTLKFYFR